MRLSAMWSEAWRNVWSGTTRASLFAILLGVIVGGLVLADAITVRTLEQQAQDFQASGAATRVLRTGGGGVSGVVCDALAGTGTISAAGGLTPADPVEPLALPTTSIPRFSVTPGLIRLLGGTADRAGAWIPEPLAHTLKVGPGAQLPTTEGTITIAGTYTYPDDGRDSRLLYAVLLPERPEQNWDECWMKAWPLSDRNDVLLRSSAFAETGSTGSLQIGQLNKTHGSHFDGLAAFEERITRFAYPLVAGVGIALGWVSIRVRRLEHAAALHARQRRGEQLTTVLLETMTWAILGTGLAAVGVTAWLTTIPDPTTIAPVIAPAAPIALGAVLLGAALGTAVTRERHLFRYFKERT